MGLGFKIPMGVSVPSKGALGSLRLEGWLALARLAAAANAAATILQLRLPGFFSQAMHCYCTCARRMTQTGMGAERRARHARKMEDGGYSQESQVTRKDTSMDYETKHRAA